MAKIASVMAKNGAARRATENTNAEDRAAIEKLAYQFFVDRGFEHGHQDEDWLRAEAIVRNRKKN